MRVRSGVTESAIQVRRAVAACVVRSGGTSANAIRRWGVIIVAATGFSAVLLTATPAAAQDGEESGSAASTVRIQARLVESGKVEFGLQLDGDRVWLPQARLFPYSTAEVGRWLFSSPYTLSDSTVVRIQARLVESGKVEFGLQLDGDRVWLPQARLFPYSTAEVGRWLFSSPFTPGAMAPVRCTARTDRPTTASAGASPPPTGDTVQLFSELGQRQRLRPDPLRRGGLRP